MDREQVFHKLEELFFSFTNKYNQLEKFPLKFGTDVKLHASEIHFIEVIGHLKEQNVTQLAEAYGVTKGAVSQLVKKLMNHGLVEKYKSPDNAKEVLIRLTPKGQTAQKVHQEIHKKFNQNLFQQFDELKEEEVQLILRTFTALDLFIGEAIETTRQISESEADESYSCFWCK